MGKTKFKIKNLLDLDEPIAAVQHAGLAVAQHGLHQPELLVSLGAAYVKLGSLGNARRCFVAAQAHEEIRQLEALVERWIDHPERLSQLFAPPPPRDHTGFTPIHGGRRYDGRVKVRSEVELGFAAFKPGGEGETDLRAMALLFHGNGEDADSYERCQMPLRPQRPPHSL